MKCFFKVIAIVLITGLIAGACVFYYYSKPVTSSESIEKYIIDIVSGDTIISVARQLESKGLIRSSYFMYLMARLGNYSIKAGRYEFTSSQEVKEILSILQDGKQKYVRVTIPEGFSVGKTAALFEKSGILSYRDFIDAVSDPVLLSEYSISASSGEGYLFPDTYFFTPGMDSRGIVSILYKTFFDKISSIDAEMILNPEKLRDTLILASIVEREYRNETEAALIAGVFTNRLKYNIGLESCATVEYIITEIEGKPHPEVITSKDLAINSPYNTYKWAGLPPGPICSPGLVALKAAAFPAKTDYYYFRLIDPEKGTHYFSKTLKEHINAGENLYTKKAAGE